MKGRGQSAARKRELAERGLESMINRVMRQAIRCRFQKHLTRQEISRRTCGNVDTETMYEYEKYGRVPGLDKFLWMCLAMEVSPMDLLPSDLRALFRPPQQFSYLESAKAMGDRDKPTKPEPLPLEEPPELPLIDVANETPGDRLKSVFFFK